MINLICLSYNILTGKPENIDCKQSGTNDVMKEEVFTTPEEYIKKESKNSKNIILENY